MSKRKAATVKSLREDLKNLQAEFDIYKQRVREFIMPLGSITSRKLMTVTPANEKGMINGLTIPELVMLANLQDAEGRKVVLETTNQNKELLILSVPKTRTPLELL
jgi:hypothetical protein